MKEDKSNALFQGRFIVYASDEKKLKISRDGKTQKLIMHATENNRYLRGENKPLPHQVLGHRNVLEINPLS